MMAKNIKQRGLLNAGRQVHAYSTFTLFCNPSSTDKLCHEKKKKFMQLTVLHCTCILKMQRLGTRIHVAKSVACLASD